MKNDFPIFKNYPDLVYLDSAATSQKPQAVIDAVMRFYQTNNSNIHRGMYDLSQQATDLFENARQTVASFVDAADASEIIFTSGTTESLNLVAFGWGREFLNKGDIVVLTEMEHHANIVPWIQLKKEIGIELLFLKVSEVSEVARVLENVPVKKIKMVSITHVSNVLGIINPIEEIIHYCKKINPDIMICIDGAQSVSHISVSMRELDCDFFTFSSHKMFGPSGVGVLYAKKDILSEMKPLIFGGGMIKKVTKEEASWADVPEKFEGGTQNIEGVIGLAAAIAYIQKIGLKKIQEKEQELIAYALEMFAKQQKMMLYGPKENTKRVGVFSFLIDGVHPHDIAEILNRSHIAVRTGHHCAQPLMQTLGIAGTARASLSLYNTREDIDRLAQGIVEVKKIFKI